MDLGYRYSACEESIDSSDFESETDSGCSQFYRQTAKVRFTRTTSKVQHHMEARAADEGRQQLFGCLRRSSSTSQMSQYLERSHAKKVNRCFYGLCNISEMGYLYLKQEDKPSYAMGSRRSPESEKRQQELEKTRREVKRMDQLQLEQQQREENYRRTNNMSSALPFSTPIPSQPCCQPNSFPDSWIAQLPSLTESAMGTEDRLSSRSPSSGRSSCCWGLDWCLSDQSSWPPHVDLEPFTGDPCQWPSFIERFKTWIHDAMPNDTLRMIYLEELLSPDLRQKYSSYLSYPGRYRNLLVQLRNHYGHPLLVVRACFEALRQLAPLDMNNSKSSLLDFSGKVQHIVATLKMVGCGEETRTFASLELSGLVCKLPENLRDKWSLHIKERQSLVPLPNLDEFATWLQEKAAESRRR